MTQKVTSTLGRLTGVEGAYVTLVSFAHRSGLPGLGHAETVHE